jgi:hypothetical protein
MWRGEKMKLTKTRLIIIWALALLFLGTAAVVAAEEIVYQTLPGNDKKVTLPDGYAFTYGFVERPQLGTVVLRLRVTDAGGRQVTPFDISGRSDMPSMAGAHDSGDVPFKLNRKGDYLLPVNIVMPGDWEVKLLFRLGDKLVFAGAFGFDV